MRAIFSLGTKQLIIKMTDQYDILIEDSSLRWAIELSNGEASALKKFLIEHLPDLPKLITPVLG
jgi:hypothetical protein